MENWNASEVIIHESVKDDLVTAYFLRQCPGVKVKYVRNGIPKEIVKASDILSQARGGMLDKIL